MPLPVFGRVSLLLLLAPLVALSAVVAPATARADEASAASEPTARSVLVTVSPLATLAGRWGGGIEWLAVPHHALTASFSYVSVEPELGTSSVSASTSASASGASGGRSLGNRIRGATAELGYRYYGHPELPKGWWLASSLILFHGTGFVDDAPTPELAQIGLAVDIGVQALLWNRIVLGVGAGVEAAYSFTSMPSPLGDGSSIMLTFGDRYLRSRIGPRLLLNVGVAF